MLEYPVERNYMVEFIVVDWHRAALYIEADVRCPICGHEFSIDTETELHMIVWDDEWVIQCPHCSALGAIQNVFI